MPITSTNPIFELLLELSHRDDSNKWSNIGFGREITQAVAIEVYFTLLIWSSIACCRCWPTGCMGQKDSKVSRKHRSSLPTNAFSDRSPDEQDGPSPTLTPDGRKNKKGSKKMPLFRRQSEKAKRRLDHLEYLVRLS